MLANWIIDIIRHFNNLPECVDEIGLFFMIGG